MKLNSLILTLLLLVATSCAYDEFEYLDRGELSTKGLHIIGAVEDFDSKVVGTRAGEGEIADSYISEMTMFVFDKKNNIVQGYRNSACNVADTCSSAINIKKANPTFLISTEDGIFANLDGDDDRIAGIGITKERIIVTTTQGTVSYTYDKTKSVTSTKSLIGAMIIIEIPRSKVKLSVDKSFLDNILKAVESAIKKYRI